jgi:hypothetical protein
LQISSLTQKHACGKSLQHDEEVKVAREDAVRQSLLDLQQRHPEAVAIFAHELATSAAVASNDAADATAKAAADAGTLRMVDDVLECSVDSDMAGCCTEQVPCSSNSLCHVLLLIDSVDLTVLGV